MNYFSNIRRTSAPPLTTAPSVTQHPNPVENPDGNVTKIPKNKTINGDLKPNGIPSNKRLSNNRQVTIPSIAVISETTHNDNQQKQESPAKENKELAKVKPVAVQQNGVHNYGFVGSTTNINTRDNRSISIENRESYQVYHEQYWSWSLPCNLNNWSKREKILLLIVTILTIIIFGLVIVVSIMADKNNDFNLNSLPFQPWRPS